MLAKNIIKSISISTFRNIRYIRDPACKNCLHFRPESENKRNVCLKFGEKNMINGEIVYDYAVTCRRDPMKCSTHGIYFTPKDEESKDASW